MSVLSRSNKQILWEVLNGLISENKLKVSNINNFREYFDNKCKEYHVKRFDYNGLSDINKHIVSECFGYLRKDSQESKLLMFREYEQYGNKNIINNLQIGKRYEEHQTNFKTMINAKRPNEVDFTEDIDAPLGNMDDAMSKRMQERESDLNSITNTYNQNHDSIKWLNNSGDIPPPKLTIHEDNVSNSILKTSAKNETSVKSEKPNIKKVKFKSDFLNNIDNEIKNNKMIEKEKDIDLKERAKQFQELTEKMNKTEEEKGRIYLEKREIIGIMDEKDNEKPAIPETDLENIFTKMKKKTNKSDIEGSQKIDLIDINKKVDKLENYIVDILKNQIDLMNQQREILDKLNTQTLISKVETQFNETSQNSGFFSAI